MGTARNYHKYRAYLKARPSYMLPYVGVYLKDVFVIKEAMSPLNSSGTLNADFVETLGPILAEIHSFQSLVPPFHVNAELAPFFSSLPVQDDEALYQWSLKCLPSSVNNSTNSSYEDLNQSVNI